MRALINLLLNLPWWADLIVIGVLVAIAYGLKHYISWKFDKIVREVVLEVGSPLKNAAVEIHSVEAKPAPAGKSPYDLEEDDEDFMEGVDDAAWDEPGTHFYLIDVTITPEKPDAAWDPTALALVPADYEPEDEVEISEKLCPLHSAEIQVNGQFRRAAERVVIGTQRIRFLFAVHDGIRAVKFGLFVTYFGRVDLPAPIPA